MLLPIEGKKFAAKKGAKLERSTGTKKSGIIRRCQIGATAKIV
jgi:hypothetical protein